MQAHALTIGFETKEIGATLSQYPLKSFLNFLFSEFLKLKY